MRKSPWILFAFAAVAITLPAACGGGSSSSSTTSTTTSSTTGSGGAGGGSTTTTTTTTTATGMGGMGGMGGSPVDCTGILTGDCGTCAEANCCQELSDCNNVDGCLDCLGDNTQCTADNQDAAQAVIDCAQTSCMNECFPPPPPPPDSTCAVPAGGKGACVVMSADVTCNPITNEPCNTAMGQACDTNGAGFQCYDPPNDKKLCETCGSQDGFCAGGLTCLGTCARFCCDNADCGAGTCDMSFGFASNVGVCIGGNGAGGAGGGGGAGGAGGAP
ncbi:MAG: hypothetical protein U0359_40970 [Byssovorax sp.]